MSTRPTVVQFPRGRKQAPDSKSIGPELSAAFLYAGIDEHGEPKFNILAAEPHHVPALLLMLHTMSSRLLEMLERAES
jgi:hypothetical protein